MASDLCQKQLRSCKRNNDSRDFVRNGIIATTETIAIAIITETVTGMKCMSIVGNRVY